MLRMESWIGYRLDLIVDPIWIGMFSIDANVIVWFKWEKFLILDMNVEDDFRNWMLVGYVDSSGYKC